jgi:hypothetical protein
MIQARVEEAAAKRERVFPSVAADPSPASSRNPRMTQKVRIYRYFSGREERVKENAAALRERPSPAKTSKSSKDPVDPTKKKGPSAPRTKP